MLSDDFDQTTDFVYEVWNYNVDGDPLMGVFDDKGTAGEFAMEQTIETGGGLMSYYPPLERYSHLHPEARARTLASESLVRLEAIQDDLETDLDTQDLDRLPVVLVEMLREAVGDKRADEVTLDYDREEFEAYMDHVAWSDLALEVARIYRTLARVRHLSVFDEATILGVELALRELFSVLNEIEREKEQG